MRRRISIRGCVRPSVRPSVRRSVRRSVTPSLRRLLGASYAEYSALFWWLRCFIVINVQRSLHAIFKSLLYHVSLHQVKESCELVKRRWNKRKWFPMDDLVMGKRAPRHVLRMMGVSSMVSICLTSIRLYAKVYPIWFRLFLKTKYCAGIGWFLKRFHLVFFESSCFPRKKRILP